MRKNKSPKNCIRFILLLASTALSATLFAQSWIIDNETALKRIAYFKQIKKPSLNILAGGSELDSIVVPTNSFKKTMTDLLEVPGANGVIMYFISLPEELNKSGLRGSKLSIVCVPAYLNERQNRRIDDKPLRAYYLGLDSLRKNVVYGSFKEIAKPGFNRSIRHFKRAYQANKLKALQKVLKSINDTTKETRGIFYSAAIINSGVGEKSMLQYINGNKSVDEISIIYAANINYDKYPHQLSLLFGLKDQYTALSAADIDRKLTELESKALKDTVNASKYNDEINELRKKAATYGDTGKPCPPLDCN